jgi:lipopolysaccharide heptosyltransferase II
MPAECAPADSDRFRARWRWRARLLRLFALLSAPLARRRPPSIIRRVLFIRPDHLGDFLFATPALERWRRHAPAGVEAILSIGPWSAALAEHGPAVGRLETLSYPGFTRQPKAGWLAPYRDLWQTARRLRRQNFDLAVILRFDHWWAGLLTYLAGIPLRLGYDTNPLRAFLNVILPYRDQSHEVQRNVALIDRALALCGAQPAADEFMPLVYHVRAEERRAAEALLSRLRPAPGRPLVALLAGAGAPVKLWPARRFAAVADALSEHLGATIVILGGPAELSLAWQIAAYARADVHVLAGQTDLALLAAFFECCDLVLGSDSGPLHLAVSVGAPTLHLFGPADPRLFGPWSADASRHLVLQSDCACAPCGRLDYTPAELPAHRCMERISVEQVLTAAERMLSQFGLRLFDKPGV